MEDNASHSAPSGLNPASASFDISSSYPSRGSAQSAGHHTPKHPRKQTIKIINRQSTKEKDWTLVGNLQESSWAWHHLHPQFQKWTLQSHPHHHHCPIQVTVRIWSRTQMRWSQPVHWSPRNTRRGGIGTQSSHSTVLPASCCAPSHFSPSSWIPTCLALPLISTGLRIHKGLTGIPPLSVTLICKQEHQSLETTLSL